MFNQIGPLILILICFSAGLWVHSLIDKSKEIERQKAHSQQIESLLKTERELNEQIETIQRSAAVSELDFAGRLSDSRAESIRLRQTILDISADLSEYPAASPECESPANAARLQSNMLAELSELAEASAADSDRVRLALHTCNAAYESLRGENEIKHR